MQKISALDSIKFGWHVFKKQPWILIGGFLITMVITGVSQVLLSPGEDEPLSALGVVLSLIAGVISLFVEIGLVSMSLKAHDTGNASIGNLWNPKPFVPYLVGKILNGLIVLVGLILLIVPGVIASLGLMFTPYLIVDKGLGPIVAMKESWRMTKGHKWQLFVLVIAIFGLNILGFIALLVGLLVTVPVSMLAVAHAYRTLEGESGVTPVPVA